MGTGRTFNKAPRVRPKKSLREAARRQRLHKQRLMDLGVPEEKIDHMTSGEMRELLKRPKKTAALHA